MTCSPSPEETVVAHMTGPVPERRDDMRALWEWYDLEVIVVQDAKHITWNATKGDTNHGAAYARPSTQEVSGGRTLVHSLGGLRSDFL